MDSTVKTAAAFALGVVTGLGIGYYISKKRQPEYTSDDSQAVAEETSETTTTDDIDISIDTQTVIDAIEDNSLKRELEKLTAKYREKPVYEDIPSFAQPGRVTEERPYVIDEEDVGMLPDYEQITLTYYADGKLADEEDDIVENQDFIVGTEWRERFEKYDEDMVVVRNDALKCDYEISRDFRRYRDILDEKPYLAHNIFNAEQMAFIDGDEDE